MQDVNQLTAQLHAAGIAVFPCRSDKAPAVERGHDWREYAAQPPASHYWPSPLVGVPVPDGCVIIDLDTYKGVTRDAVEHLLGCVLPWDSALIQVTEQGGQHYAFSVDWPVRQNSDISESTIGKGFDTRVAGKGYIATGGTYQWQGFGVMALAFPASLPKLPDACRATLEHVVVERPERPVLPEGDKDTDAIREALRHIDPGGSRSDWVKVGLALRHHYHDDEATGLALFDEWSCGGLWPQGCPANYVPEHMDNQWGSFKPEGDTTIGSLFYEAMQGGWLPPPSLDTSAAFGAGAASAVDFRSIVDRITERGSDPNHTSALVDEVNALPCAPLQRAALLATLNRELKDAGLLTKAVKAQLDVLAGAPTPPRLPGHYGKNHTENALQFLEERYPNAILTRCDQVFYEYTGLAWAEIDDDELRHILTNAMLGSLPQYSTISGTFALLGEVSNVVGRKIGDVPDNLVLFQNGVLDLHTGQLSSHNPCYFTTNIRPYSFTPAAQCPAWLQFLDETFEGDAERVALLQEWFGYMMSSGYQHHKVMLLIGSARSGKGTIGRMLAHLVGKQNFTGGSLTAFCSDAYIDSLRVKPVVFLGDAEQTIAYGKAAQVTERIKTISGHDEITFDRKYKSTLSETLPSRITIACNGAPKLFDDSGALASRLLALTFDISRLGRENVGLIDELLVDIEGVAIWALQGMARLNAVGRFTVPEASVAEMRHIAEAYSPLEQFLTDVCTLGGSDTVSSIDVYNVYRAWALGQQEDKLLARRTFVNALKNATRGRDCRYGTWRIGVDIVRGFRGLSLNAEAGSFTEGAFKPKIVKPQQEIEQ